MFDYLLALDQTENIQIYIQRHMGIIGQIPLVTSNLINRHY